MHCHDLMPTQFWSTCVFPSMEKVQGTELQRCLRWNMCDKVVVPSTFVMMSTLKCLLQRFWRAIAIIVLPAKAQEVGYRHLGQGWGRVGMYRP